MADKHILSLEVPAVTNCEILSVKDTSQYTTLLPVDCPELIITSPGFNSASMIKLDSFTPGTGSSFDVNLSACQLGLQTTDCGTTRISLPDGIYIIKYSVSPNDKVYVEYNHLRITNIINKYYTSLCDISLDTCEPNSQKKALIDEMQYIKTLIDGAVSKVEFCNSPNLGMEMYNYALKRLNKISCSVNFCK
jgi:hypothetical protein